MDRIFSKIAKPKYRCWRKSSIGVPSSRGAENHILREPVLLSGSHLHRTSPHFTPIVEADPEFVLTELMRSVEERGLQNAFPSEFFENLKNVRPKLETLVSDLKSIENERALCHTNFSEALNRKDVELQTSLKMKSRELKTHRAEVKESLRTAKLEWFEKMLKLPNKLRPALKPAKIAKQKFSPTSSIPPPNSILCSDFSGLNVKKAGGEYNIGSLARFKHQEIIDLWGVLLQLLNRCLSPCGSVRRSLLSDLARLPVVEACSYVKDNEVIHLQHSKGDIFFPNNSLQPLINPYTRTCLVGSASLAAFAASVFDCTLTDKTNLPIRLLSMGNIYGRKIKSDPALHGELQTGSSLSTPFTHTRQISFFEANNDEASSCKSFDTLTTVIENFWSTFQPGWSFRVIRTPAPELRKCEMAKWSLIMDTQTTPPPENRKEIEIASISLLGEWISRRSGFRTNSGKYPSLVYGALVNLDCILSGLKATGFYVPVKFYKF